MIELYVIKLTLGQGFFNKPFKLLRKNIFTKGYTMEEKRYTIKDAAARTGLSISALRYYDKEGLIPQLERSESGIRLYSERDMAWLGLICCLKNSGMSIEKIKEFMHACLGGEDTAEERRLLLEEHKASILEKMKMLENSLNIVNYKLEHYREIGTFHIDS